MCFQTVRLLRSDVLVYRLSQDSKEEEKKNEMFDSSTFSETEVLLANAPLPTESP